MRFALYGLHRGSSADPERLLDRARTAEDAGFEAIWVGDHIALPHATDGAPAEPRLEALVALTYIAAVTERIRVGVGVVVMPQRQPVLLAKQLASLDVLSGGRLTVGVGVGYVEPELAAMGVSLKHRGAMTDEYLAAVLALWADPVPTFAGRWVRFSDVSQAPLPSQKPHPPIVVGGHSKAAMERAVRVGDGWFGWDLDLGETAEAIGALDGLARRASDPRRPRLEITVKPKGPVTRAVAGRFADLGVDRLVLHPQSVDDSAIEELIDTAAETLIGQVP